MLPPPASASFFLTLIVSFYDLDVGYYADNMLVNPKQEDSAQVAANETVDDTEAQQTIMIIQGQDGNYEEKDGFLVQSGQVSFTQ